jgi:2,3-bisphosphoglycerate-independent phosphoglycerate mutase
MPRTVVLVVLDGWGIGAKNESNPIYSVKPQSFADLEAQYPMGSLQASGISVGLPWNETGNSEVGHLNLGAGKVVYQYFPRITLAIEDGSFFTNDALKKAFDHARANGGAVNLVGLLTKANTHAALEHLTALIKMGEQEKVPVNLHLFGDAIDGPPNTMETLLKEVPADKLATLIGRYYAMDRNENWPLVQQAYDLVTGKGGTEISATPSADGTSTLSEYFLAHYAKNLSEEFLPALVIDKTKCIKDGDSVVFFNYREDSIREFAASFTDPAFDKFPTQKFSNLFVATMTKYEDRFAAAVAFPAEDVKEPLGKVVADADKNQLRVAETYKYAHVTYFFNGHVEAPFKNEYRVLIPSLKSVHPEEHPELMASAITARVVEALQSRSFDFILVNYSNPDTMGHTGNFAACQEAVRVIDTQIAALVASAKESGAAIVITSDHGNLEEVINPQTGRIETQHDKNPVPIYIVAEEYKGRKFAGYPNLTQQTTGVLADVAPTVLALMGLAQPAEMTGRSVLGDII